MVIPPEEGGLMYSRDADSNITIVDSMLRKIITYQLEKLYIHRYYHDGVVI